MTDLSEIQKLASYRPKHKVRPSLRALAGKLLPLLEALAAKAQAEGGAA